MRFSVAAVLTLIVPVLAACGGAQVAPSVGSLTAARGTAVLLPNSVPYNFATLDDPNDLTFNRLMGINNQQKLCGYYGNGSKSNPNRGYVLYRPYQQENYHHKDYPLAVDTQVNALSNNKSIAGFYVSKLGTIFGFIEIGGIWNSYKVPGPGSIITELLGLSDSGLAVGFYTEDKIVNRAFELDESTGRYHHIQPPGATSATAVGINGKGDIVGYMALASGATVSFLLKGGNFTIFSYPGSTNTEAMSLNWQDQIAGSYVDASGGTHGFVLTDLLTLPEWLTIDEPQAVGTTVVTGIENHDYLSGWYVDSAGNTNGFMATPTS